MSVSSDCQYSVRVSWECDGETFWEEVSAFSSIVGEESDSEDLFSEPAINIPGTLAVYRELISTVLIKPFAILLIRL